MFQLPLTMVVEGEMALRKQFGRHLKHLRMAKGMTQEELAIATTLSTDFIRAIEQGEYTRSVDV